MSNFKDFIDGAVRRGDLEEAKKTWKEEYAKKKYKGLTALHWATHYTGGDREGLVKFLLSFGCKALVRTESGRAAPTSLGKPGSRLSATEGETQHFLPDISQANLTKTIACMNYAETPLEIANRRGQRECASIIRSAIKTKESLKLLKNHSLSKLVEPENGKTLLEKLLDGNEQKVIEEIKAKTITDKEIKYFLTRIDPQSPGLLHECILYKCILENYVDGIPTLITAEVVNRDSLFMGPTALETAVDCGSDVWVKAILQKLVKPDESWIKAERIANMKGSDLEFLISERRDYLSSKVEIGLNRLHVAVIENDTYMLEYVLKADIVNADASHMNLGSALSLAYNINQKKCIQILQAYNVDVSTVDKFLQTPLHVAVSNKIEDTCGYLVRNIADIESRDIFNLSVLTQSVVNGCKDVCERLVKNGAICDQFVDMKPQLPNVKAGLGLKSTPNVTCQITRRETVYSLCLKLNRTIYSGLLHKIDRRSVDLPDGNNNTLLHIAAVSLMPDLCAKLIKKTADVNNQNDSGNTPLMAMLKENININAKQIEAGMIETVNVLIDAGATLNLEDIDGCSVLEMATEYHNERLLLALIHKGVHIEKIKSGQWLGWLYKRHYTLVREILPLISKSLMKDWITRDVINGVLEDGDISLAKMIYDRGTYDVKVDVVEHILYKAAIMKEMEIFETLINEEISGNSCLKAGESLLICLIRHRSLELIHLVMCSRNGPWLVEKRNLKGQLALHVCIDIEYWDVMDLFVSETRSVNVEDDEGNTPLSLLLTKMSETKDNAKIRRLMAYSKLLISKSADIYFENKFHKIILTFCNKTDLKLEITSFFQGHQVRQGTVARPQPCEDLVKEEASVCSICLDQPKNCALNCGHLLCMTCAEQIRDCHICRKRITNRIKLFV